MRRSYDQCTLCAVGNKLQISLGTIYNFVCFKEITELRWNISVPNRLWVPLGKLSILMPSSIAKLQNIPAYCGHATTRSSLLSAYITYGTVFLAINADQ